MSAERPSEATVEAEALAKAIHATGNVNLALYDSLDVDCHDVARATLASDWLAGHDAQVRADRDREWQVARDRLADYYEARGVMVADLRALAPDVAGEGQEEGT